VPRPAVWLVVGIRRAQPSIILRVMKDAGAVAVKLQAGR